MIRKTQIWISTLMLLGFGRGNDLNYLIDEVLPVEQIKVNGTLIDSDSDMITLRRYSSGKLLISFTGGGTISVARSTGLSSGVAQQLIGIAQNALGTRNQIIASIKKGGKLLTLGDIKKLDEVMESIGQTTEIYINDNYIDQSKAAIIDSNSYSTVLEPEGYPGYKIIISESSTSIRTISEEDNIKIVVTKGLNNKQIEKLKENFCGIVAQKASDATGLPKTLLELTMSGREAIVKKFSRILKPVEQIKVGDLDIDLDKSKRKSTPTGMTLKPKNAPNAKITWKKDGKLRIESDDGERINAVYSKGLDPSTVGRIVNGLHRTITQRLGLISWSNQLLGTMPQHLESTLEELTTKIQTRTILVDEYEVDLDKASIIEISDDSTLYVLPNGNKVRIFFNGAVSTNGEALALEFSQGISHNQVAKLFATINQLFSTSVGFSKDSEESIMNFESNRSILQSLLHGIKYREKIKIDDEVVKFVNATLLRISYSQGKQKMEYTVDGFDDVRLTRFTAGDIQAGGTGRTIWISRSTGLSFEFVKKIIAAVNSAMPKKRWFFNFGEKDSKNHYQSRRLQSVVDEIPNLIQNQTVAIDGNDVDFSTASILSVNDMWTVYTPHPESRVKITRFINGDIEAEAEDGQNITVRVSQGITFQHSDTLISNVKKIVGDKVKIGPKRPCNFWSSTDDMRKLLGWLLNSINPKANIDITTELTGARKRDFSQEKQKKELTVVDYKGRGKNITSNIGGKFDISLSTGLTQDISKELVDYLVVLLKSKEDVIRMITGSISQEKIKKIKDLVKNMIQRKIVKIDSNEMIFSGIKTGSDADKFSSVRTNKGDVQITNNEDGSILVDSSKDHTVSIAVSPGLTTEQAEQIYSNIKMAFKEKFSEITNIPLQFLNIFTNIKKYFMKSYFYSAAPPKEFVSVNGEEVRLKNLSQVGSDSDIFFLDGPDGQTGVKIVKKLDGTLEVVTSEGGNINVIKTTGLDEDQIDRILRAVEYRLALKNKMFRISSDELFSPPEPYENIEVLLTSLISSERLLIDGKAFDLSLPKRVRRNELCSLFWFGHSDDIVIKRCQDGQISVDYRQNKAVSLQILPGISQKQSSYILKSLMTTIRTKSSNVKHLANYPDTFLKLLADGRIKSLDKILCVLFPREDIIVDGNRINLEPVDFSPDQDFELTEFETRPGLEITRFKNSSTQIKSWSGGHLDVHINTGFSVNLLRLILEKFKLHTVENLAPYFLVMDELLNGNASMLLSIIDDVIEYRQSGINMTSLMDLAQMELKNRLHRISVNQDLVLNLSEKAVQKQEVFIDDQLVDLDSLTVVEIGKDFITVSPDNKDYIKITRYDNGRLEIDCLKEETISVAVSAGIPPKILSSFTETLIKNLKKMDSDEEFTNRIKAKLTYYLEALFETMTEGIHNRRKVILNNNEIPLTEDLLINDSDKINVYKKEDLIITVETKGATEIQMTSPGKLELDISAGLLSKPVLLFLHSNALELANEMYLSYNHFETVAPIMTKMEKIIDNLLDSLQQKLYVNEKSIDSPSMRTIESSKEFKIIKDNNIDGLQISLFKDGRLVINKENTYPLRIHVSGGLSSADQDKLSSNIERLFSRFNPVELVADVMDILPKNFFLLAQNMDRVLSIMNLIKF